MEKSLSYYNSLDYPVVIKEISKDLGGGYTACIPMLGSHAYVGDGNSIEEALENLSQVKDFLFKEALKKGVLIPEPEVIE